MPDQGMRTEPVPAQAVGERLRGKIGTEFFLIIPIFSHLSHPGTEVKAKFTPFGCLGTEIFNSRPIVAHSVSL